MVHTTNISIVKNGPNNTLNFKKSKYSKGFYYIPNPLKNLYELNINFRIRVYCE